MDRIIPNETNIVVSQTENDGIKLQECFFQKGYEWPNGKNETLKLVYPSSFYVFQKDKKIAWTPDVNLKNPLFKVINWREYIREEKLKRILG